MVYYSLHIAGQYNPLYTLNNQGFLFRWREALDSTHFIRIDLEAVDEENPTDGKTNDCLPYKKWVNMEMNKILYKHLGGRITLISSILFISSKWNPYS